MAEDYATVADLQKHWPALPAGDVDLAGQKLHEASIEIRGNYPDLDRRIAVSLAEGGLDPEIPKLVACRMVKRAMDVSSEAPPPGFESFQYGTGPFSMGGKILNPDGNLYLTAADRRLLGKSQPQRKAWSIPVGG